MSESESTDGVTQEKLRRARELQKQQIAELFSTKPVRVILGARKYVIPANYFGEKQKAEPDGFDATKGGFGFSLFLPDYSGYTKENALDKFDRRRVHVLRVEVVDKNEVVYMPGQGHIRVSPANYGDPKAQFQNRAPSLEAKPSLHAYELDGYRPRHGRADVTWVGQRSNGEFFFFRSHLAPSEPAREGMVYPFCDVRYYSEKEDLFIVYRYSNDHLAKWREIDDAIWEKLHGWQDK